MRGVEWHVKPLGRGGGLGKSPRSCLISAGVVVLTLLFAPGLQAGRTGAFDAVFEPATEVGRSGQGSAPFPAPLPAANKPVRVGDASAQEDLSLISDAAARIAIYDIVAHRVYLPNGQRLEAHSGLGKYRDDPRHVSEKDRGPTPPNIYDLSLREHLFHGVRAIRLIPAGMGNMFGRDGMLAHTYMRGRSGQSNGCVSFSDYHTFLNVVRSGEISRLVVVEHLATTLGPRSTSEWPPETIKALLVSVQSAPSGATIVVSPGIQVTEDVAPRGRDSFGTGRKRRYSTLSSP